MSKPGTQFAAWSDLLEPEINMRTLFYDVLAERSFTHETEKMADGEWAVRFSRTA